VENNKPYFGISGNDAKVYELIVRHFLACCSKDALGKETTVEIEIAEEKVSTQTQLFSSYIV